jgi:transcriptional regulator with XRE-family HTH domain
MEHNTIGKTIRTLRKSLDLTQVELAELYNKTYQTTQIKPVNISKWERGVTIPNALIFTNLLSVLCGADILDL